MALKGATTPHLSSRAYFRSWRSPHRSSPHLSLNDVASMGRKAKTVAKRVQEASEDKERQLGIALAAYNRYPDKGFALIAREYGVNATTLWRRSKNRRTMKQFNATKRLFSTTEEEILVSDIEAMSRRSVPVTHRRLLQKAYAILATRPDATSREHRIGKQWTQHFILRYPTRLQLYWSSGLDQKRGYALNPTNVTDYFDTLHEIEDKHRIKEKHKHAMDEIGVMMGMGGKHVVIGVAGQRGQHELRDGNRESATVVCCICADGTPSMKPMVIFSGKNFMKKWQKHNVLDAMCVNSPNPSCSIAPY